jgi:ribonucleoside-diphosphate reductase alpha chain
MPGEISSVYTESWRLGLKAVAIYRDNSKRSQPLNTSDAKPKKAVEAVIPKPEAVKEVAKEVKATDERQAYRRKLSDERHAITHKFSVGQHEGYLTVGLYDNGQPGEIFITMAKEGSTVSGLMDSFATAVSLALQYGVPLKVLCDKFSHTRFEPSGWSPNPEIRYAKSVMDYIFRWLALKFLPRDAQPREDASVQSLNGKEAEKATEFASQFSRATTEANPQSDALYSHNQGGLVGVNQSDDAPSCADCGAIMVRNGACYKCLNCGSTSGCS